MIGLFVSRDRREKCAVKCAWCMPSAVPTCCSKSLREYSPCSRQMLGLSFGPNSWNGTSLEVRQCDSSRVHRLRLRAMSGVLLAFFLLPVFAPFLSSGSESTLPACCRRDGKHHCAMSARLRESVQRASSGPIATAATPFCPYRSRLLMPLVFRVLFARCARVLFVPCDSRLVLGIESILLARLSELRSNLKRGPPALLA